MSEAQPITYAELRDDDVLVDKSGGRWHVSGVEHPLDIGFTVNEVAFWLGDVRTKARMHRMTKPAGDPCSVIRVELLADTVANLEAGWPKPSLPGVASPEEDARRAAVIADTFSIPPIAHAAAIAAVEREMSGATVDTDSTAAELDAAARATDDDPVLLPLFETMTLLEQRSHLFVLHGVFADDLDDSKTLAETHFAATRDRQQLKLRSVYKPHEHSAEVK